MKLRKAVEQAQRFGAAINWVAVDEDKLVYAHITQPTLKNNHWMSAPQRKYLGVYTGTKNWQETLRRVPKDSTNVGVV